MNADGSNADQLVEDDQRTNVYPRWSPDGLELFFYSRAGGSLETSADLRRVPLAGGAPQLVAGEVLGSLLGVGGHRSRWTALYRTSETTGELFDPRTNRRETVPDLHGDPLWSAMAIVRVCRARSTRRYPRQTRTVGLRRWVRRTGKSSTAGSSGLRGPQRRLAVYRGPAGPQGHPLADFANRSANDGLEGAGVLPAARSTSSGSPGSTSIPTAGASSSRGSSPTKPTSG